MEGAPHERSNHHDVYTYLNRDGQEAQVRTRGTPGKPRHEASVLADPGLTGVTWVLRFFRACVGRFDKSGSGSGPRLGHRERPRVRPTRRGAARRRW